MSTTTANPYTFAPTPSVRVQLPEGGKVTGSVVIAYCGHGIYIGTEGAHVNDDNPGIEYAGDGYIGRVWVEQGGNGDWHTAERSWGEHFTRRDNWSDAGKRASQQITKALLAAMAEHYDYEMDKLGERNNAERNAYSAWREWAEAQQVAEEKAAKLAEHQATLAGLESLLAV